MKSQIYAYLIIMLSIVLADLPLYQDLDILKLISRVITFKTFTIHHLQCFGKN